MTIDMSKYLGLFVSEATEHLEALGRDLVTLEREGGPAVIDSMFRHAHSVKGMAASMGFEPVAQLAHRVEDLVDAVRADPSRLHRELVDVLLAATDALVGQVREVAEGRPPQEAPALLEQLSARLQEVAGRAPAPTRVARTVVSLQPSSSVGEAAASAAAAGSVPAAAPEEASVQAASAPAADGPAREWSTGTAPAAEEAAREQGRMSAARWSLKVRIAAACQVPGVRAFLVHKRLTALGQVAELKPALEDLKAGRIPEGLISLELETAAGEEAIRAALRNVSEVELEAVKPVVAAPPPAAPVPAPTPEGAKGPGAELARTVRVRTELLDYFLDSVGELLLATARIREVGKTLPEGLRPPLEEGVYRLHALVKDLHDKVMAVRMTPLSVITDRLPRAARDIARKRGREVDLVITGAEIELDRAILDELADPLLHLLRNCIDHGLESPEERVAARKPARGRVLVTVKRQRDRVVVELEDDGRGMDAAKLRAAAVARGALSAEAAARLSDKEALMLSCLPGVSTAQGVSDISGRGVGMDAVKRSVESVGGALDIASEPGRGTRFTLRLPLTVAVVQLLLVGVGDEVYGLPIGKVLGAVEADLEALSRSRDTALLAHGSGLLPVHPLSQLLGVPGAEGGGVRPFVVMEAETGKVALAVDRLLGQEEVVLKALSRPLDLVPGLAGVTILGSGRPVFILDVPRLLAA